MKIRLFKKGLVLGIIIVLGCASFLSPISGSTQKSTIEKEITDNGNNKYTIVSHLLTQDEVDVLQEKIGIYNPNKNYNILYDGYGTGLSPPSKEEWTEMVGTVRIVDNVIPTNSLRFSVDLSSGPCFPEVRSQGGQGSCSAWASTYYTNGYIQAVQNEWTEASIGNNDQLLSPAFTYNKCNYGYDHGSQTYNVGKVMKTVGVCTWNQMHYDDTDCIDWGNETAWRDAPIYRIQDIYYLYEPFDDGDIASIKTIVSSGLPVTFAFDAGSYSNFGTDDVLGLSAMQYGINHANTIVGYDDSKSDAETGETGAFKIVNSWGSTWGPNNNGYYWMTYEAFKGSWNSYPVCWFDDLYTSSGPKLIGTWEFDPQPDRDASVEVGIGNQSSPLQIRTPWLDGHSAVMHSYPSFMCLDITEFYNDWMLENSDFYVEIGDASGTDGTITSFKIEYYKNEYYPESPTKISSESPDVPENTPGYVTAYLYSGDDIPPQWRHQWQNKTVIYPGEPILLYAQGRDDVALDWAWLATNETGIWKNVTDAYGSPMEMAQNSLWQWSNFVWQNATIPPGTVIGWKIYYKDTNGNVKSTDIMNFEINSSVQYSLSLSTIGNGSILRNPNQATYSEGTPVQLTAVADPGWTFDQWTGDLTGSTNPDTIIMDDDKTVTAHFTQDQYTLTVNIVGNGTIIKDPNQATYTYGTIVELTADADPGWLFQGWTGDLTGNNNPENINMTENKVVTATFAEPTIVRIIPSAQTVGKGETFTVSVYVEPSDSIIGVSFDHFYFDQDLVHANLVTEGDLFDPYTTFFGPGTIDNGNGEIRDVYSLTVPPTGVTDPGYVCDIEFTAQQIEGTSSLDITDIIVSNDMGIELPTLAYNGNVTVIDTDTLPPEITNILLTNSTPKDTSFPDDPPGFIGGWEKFSCIVTDNVDVDQVKLMLLGDVPTEYILMNSGGDEYFCNITIPTADEYSFYIWANDTSDNEESSGSQLFELPMNEDVDESGKVHFLDLVAVSLIYNAVGAKGWIREDVNNDGSVHFMDLVSISLAYNEEWK